VRENFMHGLMKGALIVLLYSYSEYNKTIRLYSTRALKRKL